MEKNKVKKQKEIEQYQVSLSYVITTTGGKEMAKRIFTNLIKNDPHHPIINIKLKRI